MESTTNLQRVKKGDAFSWGEVTQIHEISDYSIVEYYPWKTKDCRVLTGDADRDKKSFSIYVDGKSQSQSYPSLDSALAGCIAVRHEGLNHHADFYFMKMIGEPNY